MIEHLPLWIDALFLMTCLLTIVLFHYSNGQPKGLTWFIVLWSVLHSILAYLGFYQNTVVMPPRFALILIPSTAIIIYGLLPKQQSWMIKHRNTRISTLLHSVRLPVELVLFGLFTYKMVPELMTFEGRNFDILMGISAPFVYWMMMKKRTNRKFLLIWNVIGFCLVLFILVNGILSSELPFQQFGFEQPNRAISYFPYVLLPATIVPIVI